MLALMKFKTTALCLRLCLCLCLIGLLYGCRPDLDLPEPPSPKPVPELAKRTVLVYVMADNSLTHNSPVPFALNDLDEMLEGIKAVDTEQNNLIVYMDRGIAASEIMRICRNTDNQIIKDTIKTYQGARNSVGVKEMTDVFEYTVDEFPAQSYGLVLWSHGDGWIPYTNPQSRSIGQDGNNQMNIDDLHKVLKLTPWLGRLDFLLFDACFMQSIEVAYELRDCADYFIGSPTEIPGPGAPYQTVVPALFAASDSETHAPSSAIASAYYDYYKQKYKEGDVGFSNNDWTGGVSISVIQSNQLDALASATCDLSIYSQPTIDPTGVLCYDPLRACIYYDMDEAVKAVVGDTPAYRSWKQLYDAVVIYKETTPQNFVTSPQYYAEMISMTGFSGVSIFMPGRNNSYQSYYEKLLWYQDMQKK